MSLLVTGTRTLFIEAVMQTSAVRRNNINFLPSLVNFRDYGQDRAALDQDCHLHAVQKKARAWSVLWVGL